MKAAIDAYFEKNREAMIRDLQQLVAIRSVKREAEPNMPFGRDVAAALDETLRQAEALGLSVRNHEGYVGTVDLNDMAPSLGILAHVDVVAEGDHWTKPPYGGVIEDGNMYGRGTSDDKGPVVAALHAMAAVKRLGVPLDAGVRLIVGTDEESGCADIKYYFQKEAPPPHVFSPDGSFPVVNTEKGGLRTSFEGRFEESRALPRVLSASGGYRVNVVPPAAEAVVEGFALAEVERHAAAAAGKTGATITCAEQADGTVAITVAGHGGHAAWPEQANNAVTALLTLLASLPCADSAALRALRGASQVFPHGDYYGEAAGINMADDIAGPLTVNLSVFAYSPTRAYGFIDCRTPLSATEANTMDVLAARLAEHGLTLQRSGFSPPHHTPADTPFVRTLLRSYEAYTGQEGTCLSSGGGSYVHGIPGGVVFGGTMPGVDTRPHGADEFIVVEDWITSAKIYAQAIIDLCGAGRKNG